MNAEGSSPIAAPTPGAPTQRTIAAASVLSADFAKLQAELSIVDPLRDWVHCDVMDGHFVPGLTFGPMIVGAIHRLTSAFLDVHLMIEHPERHAAAFREAGAGQITVHLEACDVPAAVLETVRATGAKVGLALKPATPFAAAEPFLDRLDNLLVMTVEPGAGGQAFLEPMLDKVRDASRWRADHGARYRIEVDGGIAPETAARCCTVGADTFVAGHAIFRQPDPVAALEALRKAIA